VAGRISLVLVNDQDCRLAIGDRDKREGRYLGGRESSASGEQTDDCIFFSRILADDLLEYGKRLRRRHAWRLRLALPSVAPADWSEAERQGLLPANSEYAQWLKGFQRKPTRLKRFATGAWDGLVHVATWLGQGSDALQVERSAVPRKHGPLIAFDHAGADCATLCVGEPLEGPLPISLSPPLGSAWVQCSQGCQSVRRRTIAKSLILLRWKGGRVV
jgi:hypothetical protein